MAHVPYVVTFHMPVIPPPPNLVTQPIPHYAAFAANLTVTPSGVDDGLVIEGIPLASAEIYAMSGGLVRYVPAGGVLPLSAALAPAGGAVVLTVMAADVGRQRGGFAPGVPPMNTVIYLNVDEVAVKAALRLQAQVMTALQLEASYERGHGNGPLQGVDLLEDHMTRAMAGTASTLVPGGAILGKAAVIDALFPALGARLEVRQITANTPNAYAPVLPVLAGAPMFETSVPGAHWIDHPLVLKAQALPSPGEFHLRFAVWHPAHGTVPGAYVPIPSATVRIVKDVNGSPVLLAGLSGTTDSDGVVHLSTADLSPLLDPDRNLHFEIDLQGKNHHFDPTTNTGSNAFPMATWSTKGWRTVDDLWAGGYEGFWGAQVGEAAAPAQFRIGLDLTVELVWIHPITNQLHQLPPGVVVEVVVSTPSATEEHVRYVDAFGRISAVLYIDEMSEDSEIAIVVKAVAVNLDDPTTGAVASFSDQYVGDASQFSDYGAFASVSRMTYRYAALGAPRPLKSPSSHVYQIDIRQENPDFDQSIVNADLFAAQIYVIQCFIEFINILNIWPLPTLISWNGGEGMKFAMAASGGARTHRDLDRQCALTLFDDNILLVGYEHPEFDRDATIFHEITHALLHLYTNSLADAEKLADNWLGRHYSRSLSNEYFAYLEGMAEFFAGMFSTPEDIVYIYPSPIDVDNKGNPLFHWSGPFKSTEPGFMDYVYVGDPDDLASGLYSSFGQPRDESGYKVEGAFATALYMIFNECVAGGSSANPVTFKRTNGSCDVLAANPWMDTAPNVGSFGSIFWTPLNPLRGTMEETTRNYVAQMRAANLGTWPVLKDIWNRLHISVTEPSLTKIEGPSGPLYDPGNAVVQVPAQTALAGVTISGVDFPATVAVGIADGRGCLPMTVCGGSQH